jgi:hypothetical protein
VRGFESTVVPVAARNERPELAFAHRPQVPLTPLAHSIEISDDYAAGDKADTAAGTPQEGLAKWLVNQADGLLALGVVLLLVGVLLAAWGVLFMFSGGPDADESERIIAGLFAVIPGLAIAAGGLGLILRTDDELTRR